MFYKISKHKNINLKISDTHKKKREFVECLEDINTYYYIYSKIPNYNFFISKLDKPQMFYELVELFSTIYLDFKTIGDFSNSKCFYDFIHFKFTSFNYLEMDLSSTEKIDLLFFDLTSGNEWSVIPMCKNINKNGHSVIKIKYSEQVLEIIYVLSTIFEKTIITRPNVMSANECIYLICQNYNNTYVNDLGEFVIENLENLSIYENIPCHFINYMNEISAHLKQQILYYKKNIFYIDEEKTERMRTKNIMYCMKWCETFNIPYNKINIFNDKSSFNP